MSNNRLKLMSKKEEQDNSIKNDDIFIDVIPKKIGSAESEAEKEYEPVWRELLPQAGVNMAYSTVLIDGLSSNKSDILIDEAQSTWIASLVTISTPIGSLLAGPLMDKYGRKSLCVATFLPIILSWILLRFAKSITIIFIARILAGAAAGLTTVSLVYTMEITHPSVRAMLLCANSIAVAFGILLSCLLALVFDWRQMASCYIGFNVVLLFASIFIIPESPHWLAYFGDDNCNVRAGKIMKSLKFLNPSPMVYEQEYSRIHRLNRLGETNTTTKITDISRNRRWKIVSMPEVYKPCILLVAIILAQQFSGTYVVIFYAISVFRNIGSGFENALDEYGALVLLGIIRFAMSVITAFSSRYFGRRVLCIISGVGMSTSMFIAAIYLYILSIPEENSESMRTLTQYKWILSIIILFYVCASSFGFAVIPWTLISELLPISFRGIGGGFLVSFSYIMMFIVVKIFPNAMVNLGTANVFLFFATVSLIGITIIYFFLPETLGKSSTDIEYHFSRKRST